MNLAYASDLHFEYHREDPSWLPALPENADVLVLAGDIDSGANAIDSVRRLSDALPNTDIIYVAGNHEFYNQNYEKLLKTYRREFAKLHRVHFLEKESLELHGVTFLGCTLWSGFETFPEFPLRDSMNVADRYIPDFRLIRTDLNDGLSDTLSPTRMKHLYDSSHNWLDQMLSNSNPERTVVISHFPPHPQLRHGKIPHGILSNYFTADCQDIIEKHQPVLWIYGHNHWCDEMTCGATRLVSNQLGYPQEKGEIREYTPRSVQL